MAKIPGIKNTKPLSLDFIAGLIAGEGYFGWVKNNNQKIAVFQLQMHYNDRKLVFAIRNSLGLKGPVYEYKHQDRKNPLLHRHYVKLLIRRRKTIKKIIIPVFDGRLYGVKKDQFNEWKEKFHQEEKKWHYHYTERIPKLIRVVPESLDEEFKRMMIGVEKL